MAHYKGSPRKLGLEVTIEVSLAPSCSEAQTVDAILAEGKGAHTSLYQLRVMCGWSWNLPQGTNTDPGTIRKNLRNAFLVPRGFQATGQR